MEALKILIVEDNIIIAEDLQMMLEDLGYNVVGIAMSYYEALDLLEEKKPDICLLDVILKGEKDGIHLAEAINEKYGIPFLFITSHSDKVTIDRAKLTQPKGYIVKPFDKDDVYSSIEMALALHAPDKKVNPSILIRQNGMLHRIFIMDILYVKTSGNYLEVHTQQGKKYLQRNALKDFLTMKETSSFCQVQKSYAVNLKFVNGLNSEFIISEHFKLPIGQKYYALIKERLNSV